MKAYEAMDMLRLPEPIEELGMEAGTPGVVDTVSDGGRMLLVDVSGPNLPASALVDVEVGDDGSEHVVGYSKLD
jgi:hypothetical protein